jgi:molybdopterin converting factor small subunit
MGMQMNSVTVRFLGLPGAGGGSRQVEVPYTDRLSVRDVLHALSTTMGSAVLPEELNDSCMVLVQGRSIKELQGWDTPLAIGDRVSVVPIVAGG